MAGLAIDSSANGTSLSTTTARFIGTDSTRSVLPLTMRNVSACTEGGGSATPAAIPTKAAAINLPNAIWPAFRSRLACRSAPA